MVSMLHRVIRLDTSLVPTVSSYAKRARNIYLVFLMTVFPWHYSCQRFVNRLLYREQAHKTFRTIAR